MSALRKRMIKNLQLLGFADKTQKAQAPAVEATSPPAAYVFKPEYNSPFRCCLCQVVM